MLEQQKTIEKPVTITGVGLHTGNPSTMTFKPAPTNHGIWFQRIDLEGQPRIKADINNVVELARGTTLGNKQFKIHTVEHVMAAFAGLQIDNLLIEIDANEPPVLDGSSIPFVKAIRQAGILEQDAPRDVCIIENTIAYADEKSGIDIVVFPSDEFRVTFMVDYENPVLGKKYTSMYSLEEEFETQFAPARTFCFLSEVEMLYKNNLIKGGNLENAIVIIDREIKDDEIDYLHQLFNLKENVPINTEGILNTLPLRFQNEMVRHKTLDLIGDLYLLGAPIKGHIIAARSGHRANIEITKLIRKEHEKMQIKSRYSGGSKMKDVVLDAQALSRILPHRYPFLLVDKIIDLVPNERVTAIKNVTINEQFFQGHFPGHPIMPGVLILESLAQAGGILLLNSEEHPENKLVYFTGLDNVKFRKPVLPGDQLRLELELLKLRKSICKMAAHAYVNGDLVCQAELAAAIIDK
ncbi:MAG: bifunctional UDP-3-O-[3-hydroxymyristoyl] N-acetylglucosamine deacetylase/3-hydroxyacyl-ACP dehydratase [Deferribacteres bacterium]|nr:bifunctional UDP-3-O-[3-hydroxymyristoyl] N-acetylglucosamine deacetylase/3-hydroxyacyl-ACP dehydratase [candidate division KSB1 bacterium]MCB9504150.1 bifunctional UDP-3-O-[3-hydroxymyristoyl] N-acetylglucosamine deacetylase/3-hydroxyacyl-ACP dehydratase [Deferribacteres bacterium]